MFALLVLTVLIGGGLYYWKVAPRPDVFPGFPGLPAVPASLRDAKTTGSVKTAFELHRDLRRRKISVSARDGVVTLRGRVASEAERARAAHLAASVPEVEEVANDLEVAEGNPTAKAEPAETGRTLGERVDDEALALKVRLAFSLSRPLADSRIEIDAFRRRITLRGTVPSAAARREAVEVARGTDGVAAVVDELDVHKDRHENRKGSARLDTPAG